MTSPFPADRRLGAIAGTTLIAPSLKVMYTPTTKVACSTIKLMLAQAEGTHRPELIESLITANISRSQTIHNPVISGLTRLVDLPEREARQILTDPEWVRIAALRDPLARSYSAWENRIFMRAPGKTDRAIELCKDVLVDGQIDMAASFALFAKMIAENTNDFTIDHHFLPQCHVVRTDVIDYNVLIRVDVPGEMAKIEKTPVGALGEDDHRVATERGNRHQGARRVRHAFGQPAHGGVPHGLRSVRIRAQEFPRNGRAGPAQRARDTTRTPPPPGRRAAAGHLRGGTDAGRAALRRAPDSQVTAALRHVRPRLQ